MTSKYTGQPVIDRNIRNYDSNRAFHMGETNPVIRRAIRQDARSSARAARWTRSPLAVLASYRAQIIISAQIAGRA